MHFFFSDERRTLEQGSLSDLSFPSQGLITNDQILLCFVKYLTWRIFGELTLAIILLLKDFAITPQDKQFQCCERKNILEKVSLMYVRDEQ